jgi:hypothetical protein
LEAKLAADLKKVDENEELYEGGVQNTEVKKMKKQTSFEPIDIV